MMLWVRREVWLLALLIVALVAFALLLQSVNGDFVLETPSRGIEMAGGNRLYPLAAGEIIAAASYPFSLTEGEGKVEFVAQKGDPPLAWKGQEYYHIFSGVYPEHGPYSLTRAAHIFIDQPFLVEVCGEEKRLNVLAMALLVGMFFVLMLIIIVVGTERPTL